MSEQENLKVGDLVDVMASGKIESISESGYMVRVHGELVPFGKLQVTPFSPSIYSMTQPKHDGKLDTYKSYMHAEVEYHKADWTEVAAIHIGGGYGDDESNNIYLEAKQALSLLAWLRQEETALEELAKGQEE